MLGIGDVDDGELIVVGVVVVVQDIDVHRGIGLCGSLVVHRHGRVVTDGAFRVLVTNRGAGLNRRLGGPLVPLAPQREEELDGLAGIYFRLELDAPEAGGGILPELPSARASVHDLILRDAAWKLQDPVADGRIIVGVYLIGESSVSLGFGLAQIGNGIVGAIGGDTQIVAGVAFVIGIPLALVVAFHGGHVVVRARLGRVFGVEGGRLAGVEGIKGPHHSEFVVVDGDVGEGDVPRVLDHVFPVHGSSGHDLRAGGLVGLIPGIAVGGHVLFHHPDLGLGDQDGSHHPHQVREVVLPLLGDELVDRGPPGIAVLESQDHKGVELVADAIAFLGVGIGEGHPIRTGALTGRVFAIVTIVTIGRLIVFEREGEYRVGRNGGVGEVEGDLEPGPGDGLPLYWPVVMPEFPDEEFLPRRESFAVASDEFVAAFFGLDRLPPSYLVGPKAFGGVIGVDPDTRRVVQLEGFVLSRHIGGDTPKCQ